MINILRWAVQFAHIYLRNMWKVIFILNSCRSRLYGTLNMQKKNQKTSITHSIFCSFSFVALKTIHIVKLWSFFDANIHGVISLASQMSVCSVSDKNSRNSLRCNIYSNLDELTLTLLLFYGKHSFSVFVCARKSLSPSSLFRD